MGVWEVDGVHGYVGQGDVKGWSCHVGNGYVGW
jgi:hypothetical protein